MAISLDRVAKLIFGEGCLMKPNIVAWVNRALVTCNRAHLQVFVVDFKYTKPFASDVSAWVVQNKVKEVALLLNTSGSDSYVLPQLMCSISSLQRLTIKGCTIAPQRTFEWPSLTYLCIWEVEIQQHVMENILSACPILSRVGLIFCWGFNCLDIKLKSLSDLAICDCDCGGHGPLLEISAPFVCFMRIALHPKGRYLRLTDISSDVEGNFDFIGSDWDSCSAEVMSNAKELLGNIQHLKVVELGYDYVEVLSRLALKGKQFPQSTSRTYVAVNTASEELSMHGIVGLLESSPNLEELVIKGEDIDGAPDSCLAAKGDLDCDLLHLKTVVIKNFVHPNLAGEPMLTLARILLKRATVLEKMVIYVKEITTSSPTLDPFKIVETLLGYPRSSRKASVFLR